MPPTQAGGAVRDDGGGSGGTGDEDNSTKQYVDMLSFNDSGIPRTLY